MNHLSLLKNELIRPAGNAVLCDLLRYRSFRTTYGQTPLTAKAQAIAHLLQNYPATVYPSDRIIGSRSGCFTTDYDSAELTRAQAVCANYGSLGFHTNNDHFAPGYETFLRDGICGIRRRIERALLLHEKDAEKVVFLNAQLIVLNAFSDFIRHHADAVRNASGSSDELAAAAQALDNIAENPPVTFREALNLVWLCHLTFLLHGKYAMALGRVDQYLYPYFKHDMDAGILTTEDAEDLLGCTFIKIGESRYWGGDDVVNICIGGVTPDGSEGINDLTYCVLHAVRNCNIPGPNLSARLHEGMPDRFLDECLQVIGTGLGYPALMNDKVNIPALLRHGYSLEDARDYCFVGCIENFIPGKQPAWSDGRFNVPEFLEAVFYRGKTQLDPHYYGIDCGPLDEIRTMDSFMEAFERQIDFAGAEYAAVFNNDNGRINYRNYAEPFMSLFCDNCIERGTDINCGGAKYPSAHGAGCMGIATVADSLAAIEKVVFEEKQCTLTELRDAMAADFEGYEILRQRLLAAPKYGNDDDYVDKYAVWYVEYLDKVFGRNRTRDNGPFYTAIASNTQSVSAGFITGATPDGRHAKQPLSDAASPTYGMDQNGPTATFLSMAKPDYTLVSCGTVLNQKYTPDMLNDPVKREALTAAIKVYFARGGQEVQINCVSRETLRDAMEHPENYASLVVRVSGFSAYFTKLDRSVQEDILHRTEHANIG